jgi:hypothetical protein
VEEDLGWTCGLFFGWREEEEGEGRVDSNFCKRNFLISSELLASSVAFADSRTRFFLFTIQPF